MGIHSEYSMQELYKAPGERFGDEGMVWVQYSPRTFYFFLSGRFAELTAPMNKRRRRRLMGKLKEHIRAVKKIIDSNPDGYDQLRNSNRSMTEIMKENRLFQM